MEEKTYSYTPLVKFTEAYTRYLADSDDAEAAKIVDDVVKERMARTGEDYSHALKSLHYEKRQADANSYAKDYRPPRAELSADANIELDKFARMLMQDLGVDYRTGLKLAIGLNVDQYGPAYLNCQVRKLSLSDVYRAYGKTAPSRRY